MPYNFWSIFVTSNDEICLPDQQSYMIWHIWCATLKKLNSTDIQINLINIIILVIWDSDEVIKFIIQFV